MPTDIQPEIQEAELASYGGWQEQEVQDVQQPSQPKSASSGAMPLLDEDDLVTPEQIQHDRPWWMQPIPRMIVAGSAVTGTLYLLFSMFGLWGSSSKQAPPSLLTTDMSTIDQEVTARIKQLQTDNENLKKEQIMGEPLPQPSSLPQPAKPASVPPEPTVVRTTVPHRTYVTQPVIASRPASYTAPPPRPVSYTTPPPRPVSYTTPPPRPVSYTTPPPRPLAPVISRALGPAKENPKIDPMSQWMAAANIGNYGGMSPVSNSQTTASVPSDDSYQTADYQTNSAATDNSNWQLSGGLGRPPAQTNSKTEINSQQSSYQEVNYSTAATNVLVGTRVNGKLETPIAWSGKLENPDQNFLIQLTEPIKAADESVAVPKGAYLVAQVSDATETGLIQMSVSSVVVTENGQTSERPISPGAILILGKGGRPLEASAQGRSSRSADLGMAVLSGVSNVTGLINQPSSQSAFSSGGGFTTTTTNRNPNYLAGFGQGAAQAIVGQMQSRNQQARQFIQSEPRVFVLNQGTAVQVFVNQSVAL